MNCRVVEGGNAVIVPQESGRGRCANNDRGSHDRDTQLGAQGIRWRSAAADFSQEKRSPGEGNMGQQARFHTVRSGPSHRTRQCMEVRIVELFFYFETKRRNTSKY